jgi:hypothetical protein
MKEDLGDGPKMKVIIAGSRDFNDYEILKDFLDLYKDRIDVIVSGCARGADILGERYAHENKIPVLKFPAEWTKYGNGAGPIRNKVMAEKADMLVAFWDGESRGTKHMIDTMNKLNKEFKVIYYKELKNGQKL